MTNLIRFTGAAIFSGVTLVLLIVSISGNKWIFNDIEKSGLWGFCKHFCIGTSCSDICITYPIDGITNDKFHVIRAFACIAVFLATVGLIVAVVRMCKELNGKIVASFFLGAGISMIIALSMYTEQATNIMKLTGASYGWSYILGWISSVLCFVAMVTNCLVK